MDCFICGSKNVAERINIAGQKMLACFTCQLVYSIVSMYAVKHVCNHIDEDPHGFVYIAGSQSNAPITHKTYIIEHKAGGTFHCSKCHEEVEVN
jgi:hypothetical protein